MTRHQHPATRGLARLIELSPERAAAAAAVYDSSLLLQVRATRKPLTAPERRSPSPATAPPSAES